MEKFSKDNEIQNTIVKDIYYAILLFIISEKQKKVLFITRKH